MPSDDSKLECCRECCFWDKELGSKCHGYCSELEMQTMACTCCKTHFKSKEAEEGK